MIAIATAVSTKTSGDAQYTGPPTITIIAVFAVVAMLMALRFYLRRH